MVGIIEAEVDVILHRSQKIPACHQEVLRTAIKDLPVGLRASEWREGAPENRLSASPAGGTHPLLVSVTSGGCMYI